jgi:formamidase
MALTAQREQCVVERGGSVAGHFAHHAEPALAATGLRTISPLESGGNLDTPQLVAGSRLFVVVQVSGALFSVGDLHFAQGGGEVCGSGIELAGAVTVRFAVHKNSAWRPRFPAFETPAPPPRRYFGVTGVAINAANGIDAMNVQLAARTALVAMIDYLVVTRGLTPNAAYALASVAVDLRIAELVNQPHPVVSAVVALDIFEQVLDEDWSNSLGRALLPLGGRTGQS